MLAFFRGAVTPKDWLFVAVIVAIIAVLGVAFYMLVYRAQEETMAELDNRLAAEERRLQTARHNAANIDQLRELSDYADQLSQQLEERLPDEQEFLTFLTTLEEIGNNHDLALKFDPGDPERDVDKITSPYTVTARGQFHMILRFINDLERYERYVRVDDIDIEYEEAGISRAEFVVNTFRFLEDTRRTQTVKAGTP